jgi:Do/DeqQ family serine protease
LLSEKSIPTRLYLLMPIPMKTTRRNYRLTRQPNKDALADTEPAGRFSWKKQTTYLLLPLIGIGVAFLGGCSSPNSSQAQQTPSPAIEAEKESNRPLTPTAADTNFVVEVVEKVEPAVVQINTSQTVKSQVPEVFADPFFRRFFGDQLPVPPAERTVRGVGSGFVINPNGQILTNAHVVNNADTVTVKFSDGRSFEGKVLGEDPVTDIAVVKIPANNLQTVALGNSEQVRPGQWAIAIGNPLGLQETVTVGVVSATDRSSSDIGVSDKRIGFIQTDAAINPGNSGGPLLNARGQVIGVNTAIIGGAQGLGFAIPIDTAREIAQQLITKGKVEHAYLGIQLVALTPEIKQQLSSNPNNGIQVQAEQGILIVRVVPGSPAARAGLRAGDVIQKINNQPVTEADRLQQLVEKSGVGSQLQIEVQRGRRTFELAVSPEALPPQVE